MQIAIDVAGFTPTEADELRQAMGAKRSGERMARLRDRLFAGMAARQVSAEVPSRYTTALAAFANFGFPESHSVAFAHLVYSTAWCKVHYPAAFTAGLLNAQPMGFWSPQSLVADAKRHGVEVRRPDVNTGGADAGLEEAGPDHDRRAAPAVRLGLSSVRGVGAETAARIAAGRPWSGMEDLVRRAGVTRTQLEALATAGALDGLETDHRAPASTGAVVGMGGGRSLPGDGGSPPGGGHRIGAASPPVPHPVGGGGRRPLGARDGTGHHRHGAGPGWPGPAGGAAHRRAGLEADRRQDHRRGRRDPPPAARERPRGGLFEPRGRDRHGQRGLFPWGLGPVEAGGPVVPRPVGTGTHRAVRGVDDPGGRALRAARPRTCPPFSRFPLIAY